MRIGDYTITNRPIPDWTPPRRIGRVSSEPVLDGVLAQAYSGFPGDEAITLRWDYLDGSPARTSLLVNAAADATQAILTGERYAYLYSPGAFRAVSAARLRLQRTAPVAGQLTLEVWTNTGAAPGERIGVVGYVDVTDIDTATTEDMNFWGLNAWPVNPTLGAYIVLAADHMTGAGSIAWSVDLGAGTTKLWTGNVWNAGAACLPTMALWQGGPYCILRGLAGARNESGGDGPQTYAIDMEDGQLYTGLLAEVDGRPAVFPSIRTGAMTDAPISPGLFRGVSATLTVVSEL